MNSIKEIEKFIDTRTKEVQILKDYLLRERILSNLNGYAKSCDANIKQSKEYPLTSDLYNAEMRISSADANLEEVKTLLATIKAIK